MGDKNWNKLSVEELEAEVEKHNRLYFAKHSPEISDYEFDRLVEALRRKKPSSKVLKELVSDVSHQGKKIRHRIPMLSLDKCYDEKTIADWAEKFEGDIVASPKIDGCAVSIKYDSEGRLLAAATRGDGIEGEDITANAKQVKAIPQNLNLKNVEVRGEVYMPLEVFSRYKGEFANPRNLAAGAIKQKDPKKTGEYSLSFFAYDLLGTGSKTEDEKYALLKKEGFSVVEWKKISKVGSKRLRDAIPPCETGEGSRRTSGGEGVSPSEVVSKGGIASEQTYANMQYVYDYFLKQRSKYNFETDGVVFKADSVDEQKRLGVTAHHPRYAIAYKFQGDSGVTTLQDVEWSVARTGVITPVAIVEPVELSGAMVRRASLHNVGLMKKLGVSKGAKVLMMRRGGVIPNLESVVEHGKGEFEIPKKCPSCGSETRIEDDFLYCTTPKSCVQSKIGELSHFVKVAGIDGFGDKLLAQLYENGIVTDSSEFYELTEDELLRMERMGETLAAKLLSNVASRKELSLDVFLQSLGIRELGRHAAKILADLGPLEKIRRLTEEELSAIHTIGPVIAREVVSGLKARAKLIDKLLKYVRIVALAKSAGGTFGGKSFLFTGSLVAMERSEAQSLVEKHGGVAAQSVTKDLDFLVVGDGGGAGSKLEKAKKLAASGGKVKIISEKEFLKWMKSN